MLSKNTKILIFNSNTIFKKFAFDNLTKKSTNSLFVNSMKFKTSYFSRMNLKEKHSKNHKSNKTQKDKSTNIEENLQEKFKKINENISEKNKEWSSPVIALEDMKKQPKRADIEIIQLNVGLNVDVRKGDQNVRGIFKMPGGAIKTTKVIAFVPPELAEKALSAGADLIGNSETIKEIQNGDINFEKCVSTIDMLPMLKNVGRILGPMGLMPNAKVGTACTHEKLESIIKDLKQGSKEFRVDQRGQIVVPVGKRDFPIEMILKNIDSFMKVLIEKKPDSIKGRYFLSSFISSRRLSYKIDMKTLDPKTPTYFMISGGTGKNKKKENEIEKETKVQNEQIISEQNIVRENNINI